jgi:hypothetical protein
MGVSKEFNSPADRAAYLAKYNKKVMDVIAKIDQVIIAIEKSKSAMSVKTPTAYSKASVDALEIGKKEAIKNLGYLDVYVAEAKASAKKAAAKLKA